MKYTVYLSGEIHTEWRTEIQQGAEEYGLDIEFVSAVTDHDASDSAGDHLGAKITLSGVIINQQRSTQSAQKH